MKRLGLLLASGAIALAVVPAFAQQGPDSGGPGPMYGYGHMWGGGWGGFWHPGMVFGPLVMLLALVGIVALIVWLVRGFGDGGHRHGGSGRRALEILEERLARGEIGKEEFEEKRRLLRG